MKMALGLSFRRKRGSETGQRILDDLRGVFASNASQSSVSTDDGQNVITIVGEDGRTRTLTYTVSDAPRKVITPRSINLQAKCGSEEGRVYRRFHGASGEQLN